MGIKNASYTVEHRASGSWATIAASNVIDVANNSRFSADEDNPLAYGDGVEASATIELKRAALPSPWRLTPVRVAYTIDSSSAGAFAGVIVSYKADQDTVILSCEGFASLIRKTRVYSPMFRRRPVATPTTATSIENPTSGSYAAGLLNWIMWQSGGRPYEQAGTYTSAAFYYGFQGAILTPRYSWVAGDDAWEEALKLTQASGGQLYQDEDGVMRYVQPLAYTQNNYSLTLTESDYTDIEESISSRPAADVIAVPYTPRFTQAVQDVIDDDQPRLLPAGKVESLDFEPKWPIVTWGSITIKASLFNGVAATEGTHYSISSTLTAAQRATIVITNITTIPIIVNRITVSAQPLVAGEAGVVEVGSGSTKVTQPDNEYIQDRAYATRIGNLLYAIHSAPRMVRSASECAHHPGLRIGLVINLTCSALGLTNVPHLIVGRDDTETGAVSGYTLCPVDDLPSSDDVFQIGTVYASGVARQLGY